MEFENRHRAKQHVVRVYITREGIVSEAWGFGAVPFSLLRIE